jgi:hypothetical protein
MATCITNRTWTRRVWRVSVRAAQDSSAHGVTGPEFVVPEGSHLTSANPASNVPVVCTRNGTSTADGFSPLLMKQLNGIRIVAFLPIGD